MQKLVRQIARNFVNRYCPALACKHEYATQQFTQFNERPVELAFLFRHLGSIYPRTVLDVGTGITALPHLIRNCGCLVTATDDIQHAWFPGMLNRHYHVIDDDITNTQLSGTYDLITCISVLEHIKNADDAMHNMLALLNPSGHLILTCPYSERSYVKNVYELPDSSHDANERYITQSFSRTELDRWTKNNRCRIVEQEYWQFWEGDHWTTGCQLIPPRRSASDDRHQLTCLLIRKD